VALVTVYFDAAYNHPDPKFPKRPLLHTVATYVGRTIHWDELRKAWRLELKKVGIDYFHMTEFEFARSRAIAGLEIPKRNPFNGWEAEDFVPFLQKLHSIVCRQKKKKGVRRYLLEGTLSSIIKADFDATRPPQLENDVQCSSYYIMNALNVMKGIAAWADRNHYRDPIHYIFAGGDGETGNLERLFTDMWSDPVAPHRFRLSKDFSRLGYDIQWMKCEPAIQAVDCAAFEMNKANIEWIERGYVDMHVSELRKSLGSLIGPSQTGYVLQRDELRRGFNDIIAHNRNKELLRKREQQLREEANRVRLSSHS
jgi:hypothetical protein